MASKANTDRIDAVAFSAIVGTACLSALSVFTYRQGRFATGEAVVVLALALTFVALGTVGFVFCRRHRSLPLALGYFALQAAAATALMVTLRGGLVWLILLPLAGQSAVLLPRRWMWGVCAVLAACVVVPIGAVSGWGPAIVIGSVFLAGEALVVAFSKVIVDERAARAAVESMAAELERANEALRDAAAAAEELARVNERNRLAREMHDSLGHYLTVINVQLEAARTVLADDPKAVREALERAQSLVREALAEVRRSVATLRSAADRSLPDAAAALVGETREAGVEAELIVVGTPRPLDAERELTLFRTAQEGLTNVRRHARASHVTLMLDYRDEQSVTVTVRDDGVGARAAAGGFGLVGIRERTELLGGRCRTRSEPGRGFTLEVELPSP